MSQPKDILALEPYYGGARKAMLEAMSRCSRHRWTILKLPPRRLERRLAAASHWFAEQFSRRSVGKIDLLLVTEALNLVDLQRLAPPLQAKPSVVYFHANHLSTLGSLESSPGDAANLASAFAATELWFNSSFNQTSFLDRATAMVHRHPEITQTPVEELRPKCHHVLPPMDFASPMQSNDASPVRDIHLLFVDGKSANFPLLNEALARLASRGEKFKLLVLGPHELDSRWEVERVGESDEPALLQKLRAASTVIASQYEAPWDFHLLMAISCGCIPIAPRSGAYFELIPESLRSFCLYDFDSISLANCVQDRWHAELPPDAGQDLQKHLQRFNLSSTCGVMDDQISRVILESGNPSER